MAGSPSFQTGRLLIRNMPLMSSFLAEQVTSATLRLLRIRFHPIVRHILASQPFAASRLAAVNVHRPESCRSGSFTSVFLQPYSRGLQSVKEPDTLPKQPVRLFSGGPTASGFRLLPIRIPVLSAQLRTNFPGSVPPSKFNAVPGYGYTGRLSFPDPCFAATGQKLLP
jgi:hypothetical protein